MSTVVTLRTFVVSLDSCNWYDGEVLLMTEMGGMAEKTDWELQ